MPGRSRVRYGNRSFSSLSSKRNRPNPDATWSDWFNVGISREYRGFYEKNDDFVGQPDKDHDWFHDKFDGKAARLVGDIQYFSTHYGGVTEEYRVTNDHVGMVGYHDSWARHLATSQSVYPQDYINSAINRGNPGRSEVDLLEFTGELRDLQSTIFPKRFTNIPIAILFGVLPLLSDIEKLLNTTESIDRRIDEINNLTGKTKKQRYGLGNSSAQATLGSGYFWGRQYRQVKETNVKAWCVKSHTIDYDKLRPPPTWGRARMHRLLYSDLPLVTAWNLMPWSWLIDYFVNVNAYLMALGNRVPGYSISSLCICVESETNGHVEATGKKDSRYQGNLRLTGNRWKHLTQRRLIVPNPTATFPGFHPILSGRQIGNLLALGTSIAGNKARMRGDRIKYGKR